jgi:uracil-DNA glycosylase family 4
MAQVPGFATLPPVSEGTDTADGAPRTRLDVIVAEARACTRCPTMEGRPRVLSSANGSERARCLVLGEAPGMHGAAKAGIPLHGDRTGDAFEKLLEEAGISRDELFISNAVLCSPKADDEKGRKPTKSEVERCTHFVRALIEHLDPAIVVSLGATALASLAAIEAHALTLKWDVGQAHRWNGRFVLPLYHPGPRATIQRPWAEQRKDWKLLRQLLDPGPSITGSDGSG